MTLCTEELYDQLKQKYPEWQEYDLEKAKATKIEVNQNEVNESIKSIVKQQDELYATIKEEIRGLANKQKRIENIIFEIKSALSQANVTLDDGTKLSDVFNQQVGEYRNIIKDSKETASNLSSYARSWVQVVLPTITDSTATIEEIKSILDISLKEAIENKKKLTNASETMQSFVDNLKNFTFTFQNWANAKKEKLTKEITDLQDNVTSLEKELADVRTVLGSAGIITGLGVSLAVVTTSAILASNPITLPLAIALWITAGISLLYFSFSYERFSFY
jgi:chromosome segregation ATPase